MGVHFISGKPRNGKSVYGVRLIVDELIHGSRPVYTNLPLKLDRLNEYLQERFPGRDFRVPQRVRLLTVEETAVFWTLRPGGVRIRQLSKEEWHNGKKPDYTHVADGGVFYVVDELHVFFNARRWALTGDDVLFYLSQHGHLSDDFVGITQAVKNVDVQFRSVAQDFTYLRYLAKEKYGVFRCPAVFLRKTFGEVPGPTAEPMETGTFRLDVSGLASCYSTVAGVGIHERAGQADMGERRNGAHWSLFLVIVGLLLLILVYAVPRGIAAIFSRSHVAPKVVAQAVGTNALVVPVPVAVAPRAVGVPVRQLAVEGKTNVFIVGFYKDRWWLSDGRQVGVRTPGFMAVSDGHSIMLDGELLRWK